MKKITLLSILSIALLLVSCKKDKAPLEIPTEYISPNYDANTVDERSIMDQMKALKAYLKLGDNVSNTISLDSLNYYFSSNGTPSIKSITTVAYATYLQNTVFVDMANASGQSFDINTASTATEGGVYNNRLVNKRGIEPLELTEKGLFLAALYNQICNLTKGDVTVADVDKMICLFGASPSFPNTSSTLYTTTPDVMMAAYTARRDRTIGDDLQPTKSGLYRGIKYQFIKIKAAIEAGSDYNPEKNEAIRDLKFLIEKAMMATVINYANSGYTNAGSLHPLSECVGFVSGLAATNASDRFITDAQLNSILAKLKAPKTGSVTFYEFATDHSNAKTSLAELRTEIQNIYGFTDQEMDDFNKNWVSAESR